MWMDKYKFSPTINPDERAKDPMPRADNPDPNGYLMQMVEDQMAAQPAPEVSPAEEKKLVAEEEKSESKD